MRLKAAIWVSAYVRRLNAMPVAAAVTRRGDADAGAIFIKINTLDGRAQVLRPAVSGAEGERCWTEAFPQQPAAEAEADAYLARQATYDPDLWTVEIEDRQGRHFLEAQVLQE